MPPVSVSVANVACGPDEPYKEPRPTLRSKQKAEDVVDVGITWNNKVCIKMSSDDEALKQELKHVERSQQIESNWFGFPCIFIACGCV